MYLPSEIFVLEHHAELLLAEILPALRTRDVPAFLYAGSVFHFLHKRRIGIFLFFFLRTDFQFPQFDEPAELRFVAR